MVVDQGPGIAPAFLSRVFEPFFQIDGSPTRSQGGTGVGLAVSRGVARGHGGELTLESPCSVELEGEEFGGCCFRLTLEARSRRVVSIYLDWNATSPRHPDVIRAMNDAEALGWANPSSVHQAGREARRLVEDTREAVARLLRLSPRDILFTGGGTEANHLALSGAEMSRGESY